MLADGRAEIMIVNNTDARLNLHHVALCRFAADPEGAPLSPLYFDCFDVSRITVDGQIRVIVNWA